MSRMYRRAFVFVLVALAGLLFIVAYLAVHVGRLEHEQPAPATSPTTLVEVCNETGVFRIVTNGNGVAMAPDPACEAKP